MHALSLCDLALDLTLTVQAPLHVGSGDLGATEPTGRLFGGLRKDKPRARTTQGYTLDLRTAPPTSDQDRKVAVPLHRVGDQGVTFYVPAASFRGATRTFLRRRLETALAGRAWSEQTALDPNPEAREDSTDPGDPTTAAYWSERFGDPIVRHLLGSTKRAGVLGFADLIASPAEGPATSRYSHLRATVQGVNVPMPPLRLLTSNSLDRFTMASTEGLRNLACLDVGTTLTTRLTLRGFAWWQVGAIALALRGMNDGELALGTRRAVGLGRLSVQPTAVHLRYHALLGVDPAGPLPGMGQAVQRLPDAQLAARVRGEHARGVAFLTDDADSLPPPPGAAPTTTPGLLCQEHTWTGPDLTGWLESATPRLAAVARAYTSEAAHA